jgi:TonB family protein
MSALDYFLTTSLYILLFYGCYWLLLRRNTFFGLNRAYLLISVCLSLLLPLVELPTATVNALSVTALTLPTFVISTTGAADNDAWTVSQWFWAIYSFGVVVMLVRLSWNLRTVTRLISRGNQVQKSNYTLIQLSDDSAPSFSFGRYLVLNHTDALTQPDVLLLHEEAHIRQHHTVDILMLEIVQVAFWFNPVLLLYKYALQEVHEFLADRAVIRVAPQPDYTQQLVAYALNVPLAALITPFVSKSTLKQRIVMLQKPQTHRRALLSYALVLPLSATLVMCTQSERDQPQSKTALAASQSREGVKVEGKIYNEVEDSPTFPGGMKGLSTYLSQNLKYPEAAQKAQIQGRVMIRFVLTKEGDITNVQVLKGIGFGADEEAMRVVKQMPRWAPAKQDGKAVNVQYHLPINFQLEESAAKKSAFFSVPTEDNDLAQAYTHFIVDGKEVAFVEFKKYNKADIVEASSSDQSVWLVTK